MLKDHKYLVCAIYRSQSSRNDLTRVDHVGIVLAHSPFSAITIAKEGHNPDGEKPSKYVASIILGTFQTTPSGRTFTCEELVTLRG